VRAAWGVSTAKRFGYSISPEDGFSAGISLDLARPALGADARGTFTRVDVRGYLPAVPRRGVIAVRASGIASRGERAGPVGLSSRHTLAIVAHDGARARDVRALARRVQDTVEARFGVRLTPEPVFWGDD